MCALIGSDVPGNVLPKCKCQDTPTRENVKPTGRYEYAAAGGHIIKNERGKNPIYLTQGGPAVCHALLAGEINNALGSVAEFVSAGNEVVVQRQESLHRRSRRQGDEAKTIKGHVVSGLLGGTAFIDWRSNWGWRRFCKGNANDEGRVCNIERAKIQRHR